MNIHVNRFNFINKLISFERGRGPFVSVYLDTRPDQNGKKDFDVFLRKQINEHLDSFEKDSSEYRSLEADGERIREYARSIDPSVEGAAIFACTAAGFFNAFEFHVPFTEDLFFVFDTPHIYPLVRLVSQHPRFAVAQADTNSAHIYVFDRGERFQKQDIQNVKTNRTEVGGWSQMRYQRHIENFHQQHAKEVVAEIEKLVRDERIEKVVLAGDEAVIIPLLLNEMSKELAARVAGTLPLNVNAAENEVFEAANSILKKSDTLEDMEKIKELNEQMYEGGRGVASLEKVLTALLNGQVQELYINADFDAIDFNVGRVSKIFKDYAPGIDERLPSAKQTGPVIDEVLKLAIQSADDIRFIEDENLLKEVGGAAALLRYQAKGVTNL
jgi:peptide chain release factor subunit 1